MALWGNKDSLSNLTGTVSINLSTKVVTGSGTTFITAGISTGDVLVVGAGATYGQAVISSVSSNTSLSIGSTQFLIPLNNAISGAGYTVTQKPKYTFEDGQYFAPDNKTGRFSAVFGVDSTETGIARTASGNAGKYAVAHAGWVGVTTYVDQHNNLRVKSEVLVAGNFITNDAADDARYPNI
jgi:hypothetical protein